MYMYIIIPKGGEGASDCVADVLGKVLDMHILIWKMPLDAYQVAVTASHSSAPHMHVL